MDENEREVYEAWLAKMESSNQRALKHLAACEAQNAIMERIARCLEYFMEESKRDKFKRG